MLRLTYERLVQWCSDNGYGVVDFTPSTAAGAAVLLPLANGKIRRLAEVVEGLVDLRERPSDVVVWCTDWTIWGDEQAALGLRHLDLLTQNAKTTGIGTPGSRIYLLDDQEWRDAVAIGLVPILYSWDGFVLLGRGAGVIQLSHEDIIRAEVDAADQARIRRLEYWRRYAAEDEE